MKNVILTLEDTGYGAADGPGDRKLYHIRRTARAVLSDYDGRIGLLHSRKRNYYKLPGGGIEEHENPRQALLREIREETGCDAQITDETGSVIEWRDTTRIQQISYCYTAKVMRVTGSPRFTDYELEDEFEVVWAKGLHAAIQLFESERFDDDSFITSMAFRDKAILKAAEVSK